MFLLPLLMVALVGSVKGQATVESPADAEAKKQVQQTEDELNRAIERRDLATLDRIYAGGLTWMARGDLLNKSQVLAGFRSGSLKANGPVKHDDIAMHVYGDTVVFTGRATGEIGYKDRAFKGPRRFTNVYVKRNGQWQQVSHSVMENW
jgi:hypothetical protein